MNFHADKPQEKKSQLVEGKSSPKKDQSDSVHQFLDNRPETLAQLTLQTMANTSQRSTQLQAYQAMANKNLARQGASQSNENTVAQLNVAQDAWDAAISHTKATWEDHIFNGGLKDNGDPNGYHSKAGDSPTHEAFGDKNTSVGPKGVYNQNVRLKNSPNKTKFSTFFPDGLTKDQVIATVASAYTQPTKTVVSKGSLKPGVPPQLIGSKIHFADDTAYPEV